MTESYYLETTVLYVRKSVKESGVYIIKFEQLFLSSKKQFLGVKLMLRISTFVTFEIKFFSGVNCNTHLLKSFLFFKKKN